MLVCRCWIFNVFDDVMSVMMQNILTRHTLFLDANKPISLELPTEILHSLYDYCFFLLFFIQLGLQLQLLSHEFMTFPSIILPECVDFFMCELVFTQFSAALALSLKSNSNNHNIE